jgi:hypothetical protein
MCLPDASQHCHVTNMQQGPHTSSGHNLGQTTVSPRSNSGQSTNLDSAAAAMRRLKRPSIAMWSTRNKTATHHLVEPVVKVLMILLFIQAMHVLLSNFGQPLVKAPTLTVQQQQCAA